MKVGTCWVYQYPVIPRRGNQILHRWQVIAPDAETRTDMEVVALRRVPDTRNRPGTWEATQKQAPDTQRRIGVLQTAVPFQSLSTLR